MNNNDFIYEGVCVDIMHAKGANSIQRVSLTHGESQSFKGLSAARLKAPMVYICVWAGVRASHSKIKPVCVGHPWTHGRGSAQGGLSHLTIF